MQPACLSTLPEWLRRQRPAPLAEQGGNASVFGLELGGVPAVLKLYPRDLPAWDRLGVELASVKRLRAAGLDCVPEPIAADRARGWAVYRRLPGQPCAKQPSWPELRQLAEFLNRLRVLGQRRPGLWSAPARDAGMSQLAVRQSIEARIAELRSLERLPAPSCVSAGQPYELLGWVGTRYRLLVSELDRTWDPLALAYPLDPSACTLSPSDVGFHNCVLGPDGHLGFVDFEYFGLDDPAKQLADLLLHPGNRLTDGARTWLTAELLDSWTDADSARERLGWQLPLARIKWCLILLRRGRVREARQLLLDAGRLEQELGLSRRCA